MYRFTEPLARWSRTGQGKLGRVLRWWVMCLLAFILAGQVLTVWERAVPVGLTWVVTESIPTGIYGSSRYRGQSLKVGEGACFSRPAVPWAEGRPYAKGDTPMCKQVWGAPGDRVVQRAGDVQICRAGSCTSAGRVLAADSRGLPLHRWQGEGTEYELRPGEYWMAGPSPRSFDSRYVGPIPSYLLIKTITPLWTKPST